MVDPPNWPEYCRTEGDLRTVYHDLEHALRLLHVDHQTLTREGHPLDIWIRNWGSVEGGYFGFEPSYAKRMYSEGAVKTAHDCLTEHLCQKPRTIPLLLDGGNLVHDGKVAILTEKILPDNPQFTRLELEETIVTLGFERVALISVEPEDLIGHADGILRFISPDVLLVNDHTGSTFEAYRRQLYGCRGRARLAAEIVPFPWYSTNERHNGIWSAERATSTSFRRATG